MNFLRFCLAALSGLALLSAGCASAPPSQQELSNIDYGQCPTTHVAQVREELKGGLLVAYAGEPLIWPPTQYWHKASPLTGGELAAGYLVVAMADQTRGTPNWLGKRLYGFIFKDDVLIRKLNPDSMANLRIREDIGPLDMDERDWQIGHQVDTARQLLIEWVPPGETVQNWSQLYTLQVLHNVPHSVGPADLIMNERNKKNVRLPACAVIEQEMLSQSATEVMYVQTLAQCAPMRDEFSIRKILRGPTAISEVSWSKTSPITEEERQLWTDTLGKVTFMSRCS